MISPELLPALTFIVGIFVGVVVGMGYESKHGTHAKEAKAYHAVILRMIPKLKPHYTSDYIYWELIQGNRHGKDASDFAKRPTDT